MGLVVAAAVGLACGAGAMSWWSERQADDPAVAVPSAGGSEVASEVRLVLTGVRSSGGAADGPLTIDGVLLHGRSGGTATVTRIRRPGRAVSIETAALPLTLSVNSSFERVRLRVAPRICTLATQWTPSSQPLVITWEDEQGEVHETVGGDHDAALEIALTSYFDAACASE